MLLIRCLVVLQGLSGGPLGAVGDLGSVALLGGLMMMTKGKGRAMLGKGVGVVLLLRGAARGRLSEQGRAVLLAARCC